MNFFNKELVFIKQDDRTVNYYFIETNDSKIFFNISSNLMSINIDGHYSYYFPEELYTPWIIYKALQQFYEDEKSLPFTTISRIKRFKNFLDYFKEDYEKCLIWLQYPSMLRSSAVMKSIREMYEEFGVDNYYQTQSYKNPHEKEIIKLLSNVQGNKVLDLCCGTGLVTNTIKYKTIEGLDPYLYKEYERNTSKKCIVKSFKDIVLTGLDNYDLIVCSFGLHLCERSMLPMLMYRIKEATKRLIIVSPSKYPKIRLSYKETIEVTKSNKKVFMREYDL